MTRSDPPAPRETRRNHSAGLRDSEPAPKNAEPATPEPLFLEPLRKDPPRPFHFGGASDGALRWLVPGYARYREGNEFSGAALFAGFAFSLAATLLYYQSWRDVAARSNSNLAYNLGATGRLDAKFDAARRNTYLSGATFVLFSILHLRDAGASFDPSGTFRESDDSNAAVRFSYSFRF